MLAPGFHDVPAGMVAAVVTHLEMTARPAPRPAPPLVGAEVVPVANPETGWYRALFDRVGGQDWLWFSRLAMDEAKLSAILTDPGVAVHVLRRKGREDGFFELDFRQPGLCELAFLGVAPGALGTGAGRLMMNTALAAAWARPITALRVHTCTFDHPAALDFYRRSGFSVTRREVEIAPDPRLTGVLPRTAAPHVPVIV
ncbi:GNAT family N-acetyltransferase [Meridianimarinicoccus roseus]|uniref:GNAT family N-acetyltransferase n=1 Tax=Meridianimarinicoccus roseus TaxID=2072018 RepID=A0A2V2LD54_9RHOB|nr:GNAT family N-acetyltransferase [Meridianimarinicoccus roseus]PWR03438.1 GNAT family N-acetyltransferase [Meridianimarinicoccus roseus]